MKKLFVSFVVGIAFVVSLGLGSANAMPIMIDVGAAGITGTTPDGDNLTGVFDQLGLYVQTTSTPTGPGAFRDVGDVNVHGLLASTSIDEEGLNTTGGWELTGRWDDLVGTFVHDDVANTDTYTYTSGTLSLYADASVNHNFGDEVGSNDDCVDGTGSTFTDGTQVATAKLTGGTGLIWWGNPQGPSGDTITNWIFTSMLADFWLDQDGNDLSPYVDSVPGFSVVCGVDINTYQIEIEQDGGVYYIHSAHDGSASVDVVPEPTTMLLLGTGLIGLAGLGRRRFVKKG
jgi:PEP-CTERM putative exosortase interaction domain